MDWPLFYTSPEWAALRGDALRRDANRCQVARLLGGDCSSVLHVHHLTRNPELALDLDNVATVCSRHHPQWDALRRAILDLRPDRPRRCRHNHRYDHAREACRRKLAA